MTLLPPGVKVHLAFGYTDMRKGIDGLAMLVQSERGETRRRGSQIDRPSLPSHLTREEVRFDPEHEVCPCCGGKLHVIGETVSEVMCRRGFESSASAGRAMAAGRVRDHSSGARSGASDR